MQVREAWGLMLSEIPGVGNLLSDAILRAYPTPISLWSAYRAAIIAAMQRNGDAVAAANGMLVGLTVSQGIRKVTARESALVYRSLFSNGWQVA